MKHWWTKDDDALLKKLKARGLSARMIANEIGGVTKNAVLGRMQRLRAANEDAPRSAPRPVRKVPAFTPRSCQYPFGDPKRPGFHFCGAKVERGSYCAAHAAVCYKAEDA